MADLTLVEALSRGPTREVWQAEQVLPGAIRRSVVIKRVMPLAPKEECEALLQEASILSAVRHPGIIQLIDISCIDDCLALVLEHVPGGSWDHLVNNERMRSSGLVAWIGWQLAEALGALHQSGWLHGDLSPRNVVLSALGQVKLLDLGAAQYLAEPSPVRAVGTPRFMAPEQLLGERLSPRTDIFALGCLIHWALTGDSPADGLVLGRSESEPRLSPNLPEPLVPVIRRATQYHPKRRYPDAETLAIDLAKVALARGYLRGQQILARTLDKKRPPTHTGRLAELFLLDQPAPAPLDGPLITHVYQHDGPQERPTVVTAPLPQKLADPTIEDLNVLDPATVIVPRDPALDDDTVD